MATLPTLYCIHGADAPQHLGRIQQISQKFKKEQRIADFMLLPSEKAADILPGKFREDDLIILLLTYELESKRRDITTLLSQIRTKIPESKIAEIIIDNIPFVNNYITLPVDLKPIRDAQNMDSVWQDIEENLKRMLPTRNSGWTKYLKYAIPLIVVVVVLLLWRSCEKNNDLKVAFSASPMECQVPCKVNFKNASENASGYEWSFDDGATSSETDPAHTFEKAGTYNVKLVASFDGKKKETTQSIKVSETTPGLTPKAAFSSDKTKCDAPCTIVFSNSSQNADRYLWDFGNGTTSEEANPTITFNTSGTFKVKLSASANNIADAITHDIVVGNAPTPTPTPVAQFVPDKTSCRIPCTINFRNQSQNATSFSWDFGDGTSSTETSPSHRYNAGGDYQIKLVARNTGGQIEATARVLVSATATVPAFQIRTTGNDARIIAGDGEIDSDDWTSVELSYSLSIANAGQEIQLNLEWYAQERNSDRSRGNSRFRSSKTFTVFRVSSCCPGTVIADIEGIDRSGRGEEYYRGEVHSAKPFPVTGSLQNIEVRFDGDGGHDERLQSLRATLPGFSVKLRTSN